MRFTVSHCHAVIYHSFIIRQRLQHNVPYATFCDVSARTAPAFFTVHFITIEASPDVSVVSSSDQS